MSKLLKTKVGKGTKLGNRVRLGGGRGFRVLACADTGSEDPPWRAPVFTR